MNKLVNIYNNLSPERKALFDMVGMLITCVLCAGIVAFVAVNGFWMEVAFLFICFGIFGMLKSLYESRVFHHKIQDQLKK